MQIYTDDRKYETILDEDKSDVENRDFSQIKQRTSIKPLD